MDKYAKRIRFVFFATFIVLCLQYAYAIIVEEAYPSIVMPAFARANITNNQTTYSSIYFSHQGIDTSYTIADMFPGFSQAGARELLDKAFFSPEPDSSVLTGKDKLIIRFLGEPFYNKVVAPFKSQEEYTRVSYPEFEQWLCEQADRQSAQTAPASLTVYKILFTQDMINKNILQQDTLVTYAFTCPRLE